MNIANEKNINEYTEIFKALAHPTRLTISYNLMSKEDCNVSRMCDCLGIPQPTISQHLSILKNAKIIVGRRKGNQICYSVENPKVIEILKLLVVS